MSKALALIGFAALTAGYVGFGSTSSASIGGIGVQQAQVATQATNTNFGSDNCSFELFKRGITANESGGDYRIRAGKSDSKGRFAYGKYQVMEYNIPKWTEEHCGQKYSIEEFRGDPECQEKTFKGEVLKLYAKYGNWGDVASSWFSGAPLAGNNGRDAFGTTVPGYVGAVLNYMRKHSNECISTSFTSGHHYSDEEALKLPGNATLAKQALAEHCKIYGCPNGGINNQGVKYTKTLSNGVVIDYVAELHTNCANGSNYCPHTGISTFAH